MKNLYDIGLRDYSQALVVPATQALDPYRAVGGMGQLVNGRRVDQSVGSSQRILEGSAEVTNFDETRAGHVIVTC